MDKTGRYLQQIHALYPNLEVKTARLNEQGQYNDGLILNDEFIFRFPKVPVALGALHLEYEILCNIQEYLTLPIPNPIWSNIATDKLGEAFIGYHLIPGQPFWRETYLAIKYEAIIHYIAVQIATFLQQLHSIPIKSMLGNNIPVQDTRSEWAKLYLKFRDQLFPYLKQEDRDREPDNRPERYLLDDESQPGALVLSGLGAKQGHRDQDGWQRDAVVEPAFHADRLADVDRHTFTLDDRLSQRCVGRRQDQCHQHDGPDTDAFEHPHAKQRSCDHRQRQAD